MTLTFIPATTPFPRWCGPYSVARGTQKSGFRFLRGRLGAWVERSGALEFWTVESSPGVTALERLVQRHWGSGRVLLLPDGHVVKPDPDPTKACTRYLIGRVHGSVIVERPDGTRCDLLQTQHLRPGELWHGPGTTGIECKIDSTGRLECEWELSAATGRLAQTHQMWGADTVLAAGLRQARPRMVTSGARVRVQVGGTIITVREDEDYDDVVWTPRFVGRIDVKQWPHEARWVIA